MTHSWTKPTCSFHSKEPNGILVAFCRISDKINDLYYKNSNKEDIGPVQAVLPTCTPRMLKMFAVFKPYDDKPLLAQRLCKSLLSIMRVRKHAAAYLAADEHCKSPQNGSAEGGPLLFLLQVSIQPKRVYRQSASVYNRPDILARPEDWGPALK